MAILPIITAPSARLKVKSEVIESVDDAVRRVLDDMLETMYAAPGIGLAAIQIGVPKRAIVVDLGRDAQPEGPLFLVNPEITWASDDVLEREEGCLSLPEQYADVARPSEVKVSYLDYHNERREVHVGEILVDVHPARNGSSRRDPVRRSSVCREAQHDRPKAGEGAQTDAIRNGLTWTKRPDMDETA